MSVGFVAALGLVLIRWLANGSPVPMSQANVPILIFLTMVAIGFALSPAPDLAVGVAGQAVASVTIFFALLDQVHSSVDLWRIAGGFAALGILLAVVAPFTVDWAPNKLFGLSEFYVRLWPRLPKETNSNILAGALAPIVPVSLALVAQGEHRIRILGAISLAPLLVISALLQSRGALFGLAIGLAVWATLYRRWILPLVLIALLGILVINGAVGGPSPTQLLYGDIGAPTPTVDTSFIQRQDLWIQSFYLIHQFPLFGIGLGAYTQVAPYAWPYSFSQPGPIQNHTHNLFLQIALDTGILGVAAFAVLLLYAFRSAWVTYSRRNEPHLAIGIMAAMIVVVVHGMGDVIVWGTSKSSVVLWILLSLAFGLDKVRKVV